MPEQDFYYSDAGDAEPAKGAYFPQQYLIDFLRFVAARPHRYQIITYDDLLWGQGERYPGDYKHEHARWLKANRKSDKIFILLQHDVDSQPQRTMSLLRHEAEAGTPSNSMIFAKRIDRKRLKHVSVLEETPYDLDHDLMAELAQRGFVFGYHCNAVERSMWNLPRASEIFTEDVLYLRRRYPIRYFSPHGGVPSPDGLNNTSIEVPSGHEDLIWVHNLNSPLFRATYSDGGINNATRDPAKRNLIDFVRSMAPGNRYRILTHPQYFDPVYREAPILAQSAWYQDLIEHYRSSPGTSLWEKVLG